MRVSALTTFPVKSCAGVSVSTAEVGLRGLRHDRAYMVVAPDGTGRTQRRSPRLALVRPSITDDGLVLAGPGVEAITVPWDAPGDDVAVSIFGVGGHHGVDRGDDVARWLTEVLGEPSRLVATGTRHDRRFDGVHEARAAWADSGAVTMVSRSSRDELSDRLVAEGGEPMGLDRFRMNVVLSGSPDAHGEDALHRVRIGTLELGFQKLAVRCAVVTVDQDTGERDGPEPLRTLASYRRDPDGGVVFGAKFAVLEPGTIAVGDELHVRDFGGHGH